jgi:tetratricopeptide (TPR) repeat protein
MPRSLHQIWSRRLGDFLLEHSEDEAAALGLAATLGLTIDRAEWRAVCAAEGLVVETIGTALVKGGLAVGVDHVHWSFAHPMLREAALAVRPDPAACHLRCARVLQGRAQNLQLLERIARHLHAGGANEEAWPLLLRAGVEAQHRSVIDTLGLLGLARDALDTIAPSGGDLRLLAQALREAEILWHFVQPEGGEAIDRLAELLEDGGPPRFMGALRYLEGVRAVDTGGENAVGVRLLEQAVALLEPLGSSLTLRQTRERLSIFYLNQGDIDAALAQLDAAGKEAMSDDDRARLDRRLAHVYVEVGNWVEAERVCRRGLARAEGMGHLVFLATMRNQLGDIRRFQGAIEEAEALYRLSLAGFRECGYFDWAPQLNLAALATEQGDHTGALQHLAEARKTNVFLGIFEMASTAIALVCWSALGEVDRVDACLDRIEQIPSMQREQAENVELLRQAADHLTARGEHERALRANRATGGVEPRSLG